MAIKKNNTIGLYASDEETSKPSEKTNLMKQFYPRKVHDDQSGNFLFLFIEMGASVQSQAFSLSMQKPKKTSPQRLKSKAAKIGKQMSKFGADSSIHVMDQPEIDLESDYSDVNVPDGKDIKKQLNL
jgi:hypothetical protein